MTIRIKLLWTGVCLFMGIYGCYILISEIIEGQQHFNLKDMIGLALFPFVFYLFVFLAPTLRIRLSEVGINASWKIGVGPFRIWEQKNYRLRWEDLTTVYLVFPPWIPFHIIGVAGYQHDLEKGRNFFIGFATTKKKESLLYIADHVVPQVITDEVWTLVKKYRKQLEEKKASAI